MHCAAHLRRSAVQKWTEIDSHLSIEKCSGRQCFRNVRGWCCLYSSGCFSCRCSILFFPLGTQEVLFRSPASSFVLTCKGGIRRDILQSRTFAKIACEGYCCSVCGSFCTLTSSWRASALQFDLDISSRCTFAKVREL